MNLNMKNGVMIASSIAMLGWGIISITSALNQVEVVNNNDLSVIGQGTQGYVVVSAMDKDCRDKPRDWDCCTIIGRPEEPKNYHYEKQCVDAVTKKPIDSSFCDPNHAPLCKENTMNITDYLNNGGLSNNALTNRVDVNYFAN